MHVGRPAPCLHGRDLVLQSGAPDVRFEMDSVPNSGVPELSTESPWWQPHTAYGTLEKWVFSAISNFHLGPRMKCSKTPIQYHTRGASRRVRN